MARSHRSLLTFAAVAFAVTWRVTPALAYPVPVDFQGNLMRWDTSVAQPQVTYEVTGEPEDVAMLAPYVAKAADLWNDVPGSFVRYVAAEADVSAMTTIHLARSFNGGSESAGYAVFDEYHKETPTHCQIEVEVDDQLGFYSFGKTALHEMGHCLGLGHTLIPKAIMSYYLAENAFALDTDDKAAVARLYPADGSQPKLPPGCAVGESRPANSLFFWLLLLPMLSQCGRPLSPLFRGLIVRRHSR